MEALFIPLMIFISFIASIAAGMTGFLFRFIAGTSMFFAMEMIACPGYIDENPMFFLVCELVIIVISMLRHDRDMFHEKNSQ